MDSIKKPETKFKQGDKVRVTKLMRRDSQEGIKVGDTGEVVLVPQGIASILGVGVRFSTGDAKGHTCGMMLTQLEAADEEQSSSDGADEFVKAFESLLRSLGASVETPRKTKSEFLGDTYSFGKWQLRQLPDGTGVLKYTGDASPCDVTTVTIDGEKPGVTLASKHITEEFRTDSKLDDGDDVDED